MFAAREGVTSVGPVRDCLDVIRPPELLSLAIAVCKLPGAAQAVLDLSLVSHTGAHAHAKTIVRGPTPSASIEQVGSSASRRPTTGRAAWPSLEPGWRSLVRRTADHPSVRSAASSAFA